PAVKTRLAVIRQRMAELNALGLVGKWKEPLPLAEKLVEDARALGWAPIEAETLFLLGDWKQGVGDGPAAEAVYKSALLAAARARDDSTAAWSMLALLR